MENKRILILANKYSTILNFRLEVVDALIKNGYEVYVSLPHHNRVAEIDAIGAKTIDTQISGHGTNPIEDFKLMLTYTKLIKKIKPSLVLTYTIKPNVYGGMACTLCNVPYVANITGLGTAVENGGLMQKLTVFLYRLGLGKASTIFFQNRENRAFFEKYHIAVDKHESLPGSGVNLSKFELMDYPVDGEVHFAFISRIMREKGIEQYLDAARVIKNKYSNVYFHVCGFGSDEYEAKMKKLDNDGLIIYHGLLDDVRVMLKDAHCVIHPTFYPEGMSNVLLESAASGRPIISTDRPGCREAIDNGVNGYIVQEQNSEDLIEKVEEFLNLSYEKRKEMGIKGREKVTNEFDRNIVVNTYLEKAQQFC